jgi:hypothetical protein
MIAFIDTSLQLQPIITDNTMNSFWTTSVLRIRPKNLSLLSGSRIGLCYSSTSECCESE